MEIEMSNTVRALEDEAERLNSRLSTEEAQMKLTGEQHLIQIDEMTRYGYISQRIVVVS